MKEGSYAKRVLGKSTLNVFLHISLTGGLRRP